MKKVIISILAVALLVPTLALGFGKGPSFRRCSGEATGDFFNNCKYSTDDNWVTQTFNSNDPGAGHHYFPYYNSNRLLEILDFRWSGGDQISHIVESPENTFTSTPISTTEMNTLYRTTMDQWDKLHAVFTHEHTIISNYAYGKYIKYITNASGSWVERTALTADTGSHYMTYPQIVVDEYHIVHIVFLAYDSGVRTWKYSYGMDTGTDPFSTPVTIGSETDIAKTQSVGFAGNNAYLMLAGENLARNAINSFLFSNGSWGEKVQIDTGAVSSKRNILLNPAGGNKFEFYFYYGAAETKQYKFNGNTWGPKRTVGAAGYSRPSGPAYVDKNGRRYITTDYPIGVIMSDSGDKWYTLNYQGANPGRYSGWVDDTVVIGDSKYQEDRYVNLSRPEDFDNLTHWDKYTCEPRSDTTPVPLEEEPTDCRSDGFYLNDDFTGKSDWNTGATGAGVFVQADSAFKLDSGSPLEAGTNNAWFWKDLVAMPDDLAVTIRVKVNKTGTDVEDSFFWNISTSDKAVVYAFYQSDGLWLRDHNFNLYEVGTDVNLVCSGGLATGCDQWWTYICTGMDTTTPTCDIYRYAPAGGDRQWVRVADDTQVGYSSSGQYTDGRIGGSAKGRYSDNISADVGYYMVGNTVDQVCPYQGDFDSTLVAIGTTSYTKLFDPTNNYNYVADLAGIGGATQIQFYDINASGVAQKVVVIASGYLRTFDATPPYAQRDLYLFADDAVNGGTFGQTESKYFIVGRDFGEGTEHLFIFDTDTWADPAIVEVDTPSSYLRDVDYKVTTHQLVLSALDYNDYLIIYDLASGSFVQGPGPLHKIGAPETPESVKSVAMSHNGAYLALGSFYTGVRVFNSAGTDIQTIAANPTSIAQVLWTPDDTHLLAVKNSNIYVYNTSTWAEVARISAPFSSISTGLVSISKDGLYVTVPSSIGAKTKIYSTSTWTEVDNIPAQIYTQSASDWNYNPQ
jgi:hypothetical protein